MSVTITRAQPDALYDEVLGELTGIGDIYLSLDQGDAEQARRLWERFAATAASAGGDRLGAGRAPR